MAVAWFLAPYARTKITSHPGRYCVVDDFTPQITAAKGDWAESEILGNAAVVKVRSEDPSVFDALTAKANVLRLPDKLSLADSLGDVASKQQADIVDYLKGLGYAQGEIDSKVPSGDWSTLTLGQLLDTAAARRGRPVYDAKTDTITFDTGQLQPVKPIASLDAAVAAAAPAVGSGLDAVFPIGPAFHRDPILLGRDRRGRPIYWMGGGAFPSVSTLIDDFNRASLGANWTTGSYYGDSSIAINTNQLTGTAGVYSGGYYNATSYGPDCDLIFTLATTDNDPSLILRSSADNSPTGAYQFHWDGAASEVVRIDSGTATRLGAAFSATIANGDKLGAEASGSTLTLYRFTAGAWGAALASRTDATYGAAGKFAAELNGSTVRFDDMSGGTISAGGGLPFFMQNAVMNSMQGLAGGLQA